MYFLSTLHPKNSDINGQYRGMYFSRPDKESQIRKFYRERLNVPLCLDHCGGESAGVVVSPEERIGRVLDLFINRNGEMMAKLKLDDRHPAYRKIKDGIHSKGEKWGVSVWIQHVKNLETGRISKELGHVALTTDPLFAEHNTFLHWYGVQESGIDKMIAKDFYHEGVGQSFSAREMKLKLEDSLGSGHIKRMSDDPTQQQSVEMQQNQSTTTENTSVSFEEPQTKRFKSGDGNSNEMNQEHIPLSQIPGPNKSGPTSSVFKKLDEFEREHSRSGIPPSRYDKEHRAEYLKLLAEKEAYEEMIVTHMEAIKDEQEFKGQDHRKWIDSINSNDLGGATAVVGFAAASANMHAKMLNQVAEYKRKWEDAEKRANTMNTAQSQQQQPIKSSEIALKSFNQKPSAQTSPSSHNNNENNYKASNSPPPVTSRSILAPSANKMGLADLVHNPNQTSVVDGNSLLKAFSAVQYELHGHAQPTH